MDLTRSLSSKIRPNDSFIIYASTRLHEIPKASRTLFFISATVVLMVNQKYTRVGNCSQSSGTYITPITLCVLLGICTVCMRNGSKVMLTLLQFGQMTSLRYYPCIRSTIGLWLRFRWLSQLIYASCASGIEPLSGVSR